MKVTIADSYGALVDAAEGDWGGQAGMLQVDIARSTTGELQNMQPDPNTQYTITVDTDPTNPYTMSCVNNNGTTVDFL